MIFLVFTAIYNIGSIGNIGYLSALILTRLAKFNVNYYFIKLALIVFLLYCTYLFSRENHQESIISVLLLLPLYLISEVKEKYIKNAKKIYILVSVIYLSFAMILFKENEQIFFNDKNIFMVPFVPLILYYAYNLSTTSILIAGLCYLSDSRLTLYIFLLTIISSFILRNVKYKNNLYIIIIGILSSIFLLLLINLIPANEIDSRGILNINDASNLERADALLNAITYLQENLKTALIGGGWENYSDTFNTRVHNDFIQLIIKHGIFYLIIFIIGINRLLSIIKIPVAVTLSLVIYSSLLGGIGWFGGIFWIFPLILLFAKN